MGIIWQSVSTKVPKYAETFCQPKWKKISEQLKIICNFTTFNTITLNKNCGQ